MHKCVDWIQIFPDSQKSTLLAAVLGTLLIGTATADDTEIFFSTETQPPNVLFIVDVSGSMDRTDNTGLPDIADSVLWLDASDATTLIDANGDPLTSPDTYSGPITQWRDKSGQSNHLTGTSATLGTINERTTVRFTDDIMQGPDVFGGTMNEATIFAVLRENSSSDNFFLSFNGSNTNGNGRVSFHTPWSKNRFWYWDAGNTGNQRSIIKDTQIDVGAITQLTAYKTVAGNENGISLNNSVFEAIDTGAIASATSGGVYIGHNTKDHELAELIVYDRYLNDDEITQVQNYLDQKWRTRLDRFKEALTTLLESAEGFNAGLMSYTTRQSEFRLLNEINPVAESRDSLIDNINATTARGGTPTQSAMFEGMRYFRGEPPIEMGGISSSGPPALEQCQGNHIVVLTDGNPSGGNSSSSWPAIGNYIGSNCANDAGDNRNNGNCGIELAQYMNDNDHYPGVRGVDNITTHTIGLNLDLPWLDNIATAGGGGYYSVGTTDQLLSAFELILNSAFDNATTFVSPAVTIDQFSRLSHRDDTYLALFQPSTSVRWPGNLKRYSFSGNPPSIRDQNGVSVLDTSTGIFKDSAHSYWSESPDGNSITRGGAASQLDIDTRIVATYTGDGTRLLTDARNLVHEDNAGTLGAWINAQGAELATLLAWARGVDVDDEDADGSTTDTRNQMGDPLHSNPAILNYGGTSTDPDSVVFVGTNEGYLHAFNSQDGHELFAFIPPELLGNLKTFYENSPGIVRPYGLDGDLTLWLDDKNENGTVDPSSEHAYLYAGMRRGGKNYYALDVTEKSNPQYLWTISGGQGTDFAELGQTWSKQVKSTIKLDGQRRHVLIFGGGYDTKQDHATIRTADTVGNTLFIVDALDGSLVWKASSDSNSDYSQMIYSMPSDPRVLDVNGDGLADQIYIGDMGGQIWRFDVNNNGANPAQLITGGIIADLAGTETENNRRFFYPPDVALIQEEDDFYLSVAIGSGNRTHPLGRNVDNQFYMIRQSDIHNAPEGYGVIDTPATDTQTASYRPIREHDLFDATDNNVNSADNDVSLAATAALQSSYGWRLNLNGNGEKVLGTSATINNQIIFATYIPDLAGQTTNICQPASGGNRAYVVNLFDASPVSGSNNPDERHQDIEQPGIAGTVSVIIDRHSDPDSGEEDTWSVNAIVALDPIKNMPTVPFVRRLYWSEYPDF